MGYLETTILLGIAFAGASGSFYAWFRSRRAAEQYGSYRDASAALAVSTTLFGLMAGICGVLVLIHFGMAADFAGGAE